MSLVFHLVPFLSRMCPSDTYKIWKKGKEPLASDTQYVTHIPLHSLRHNSSSRYQSSGLPAPDLAERKPLVHL